MSKNSTGTNSATNRSGSNRVSDCYSNKSENRTSNKSVNTGYQIRQEMCLIPHLIICARQKQNA